MEARNGREGVQSVNRNRLDLVVTDILMPEQDGVETIRRIRAIDSRLPIIAMSGAAEGTGLGSLLSTRVTGADSVLGKPFTPQEFLAALEKLLERHATGRESLRPQMIYHVVRDSPDRWAVRKVGATHATTRTDRKEDAVALAQKLASSAGSAMVLVHRNDGSVEAEYTYRDA